MHALWSAEKGSRLSESEGINDGGKVLYLKKNTEGRLSLSLSLVRVAKLYLTHSRRRRTHVQYGTAAEKNMLYCTVPRRYKKINIQI